MTALTIDLSDEQRDQLQEMASRLGVSLEDLVQVSIDELLARPELVFDQNAQHVLKKNAELYRRLT